MTRRGFFALFLPGFAQPSQGGFVVTGHFDTAGEDPRQRYFSLGQGLSLMIDPERLPSCASGAESLVGGEATISLIRA